jgi:hypothetical protein
MDLSSKEIDNLIIKLRGQYIEYGEKVSKKMFDSDSYETRLKLAINNKMNLESFILAEIATFEKLKEKYEKKKKAKEKSTTFSQKIDTMIEENNARIVKYTPSDFSPLGNIELKHFYGALNRFCYEYFTIMWIVTSNMRFKETISAYDHKLTFFGDYNPPKMSKRIEDHILIINRPYIEEIDIERDRNNFLKEAAFLLHDIFDFCYKVIDYKESNLEMPIQFDKLFNEGERRKKIIDTFHNLTGYGAVLKVQEKAGEIIEDFRLGAFKKNH